MIPLTLNCRKMNQYEIIRPIVKATKLFLITLLADKWGYRGSADIRNPRLLLFGLDLCNKIELSITSARNSERLYKNFITLLFFSIARSQTATVVIFSRLVSAVFSCTETRRPLFTENASVGSSVVVPMTKVFFWSNTFVLVAKSAGSLMQYQHQWSIILPTYFCCPSHIPLHTRSYHLHWRCSICQCPHHPLRPQRMIRALVDGNTKGYSAWSLHNSCLALENFWEDPDNRTLCSQLRQVAHRQLFMLKDKWFHDCTDATTLRHITTL